ncbi:hypothetical protein PIIN_05662 [Serendipita indica DSM 11827]|uniref:Uncharacterized protein n=1 Tax=Serendipita indica (strain DSM 11827) TaxID=1109443 RepID=G4TK83_SERID|nr:hypothetical protein PIIN_05662 [Serendipita indica DSM 11827]
MNIKELARLYCVPNLEFSTVMIGKRENSILGVGMDTGAIATIHRAKYRRVEQKLYRSLIRLPSCGWLKRSDVCQCLGTNLFSTRSKAALPLTHKRRFVSLSRGGLRSEYSNLDTLALDEPDEQQSL